MPLTVRIRREMKKQFDDRYGSRVRWMIGVTGDRSGTVKVPGMPGYIWVRDWAGTPHKVFNTIVPTDQPGYIVKYGYDPFNTSLLRVLGFSNDVVLGGGGVTPPEIGPHHESHEWPGSDTVNVYSPQLVPALVAKNTGLTVTIYPFYMRSTNGTYVSIPLQDVDLTSYVPASGACWVLISFDPDGNVVITDDTTATSMYLLRQTPIDVHPDATYMSLAAVALDSGSTEIIQTKYRNDVVDLRWSKGGGGGGGSGDMFKSVYDTNNDGVVDDSGRLNGELPAYYAIESEVAHRHETNVDPTADDDITLGYVIGDIWVNYDTPQGFVCLDNTDGNAVWQEIGGGSGGGGAGDLHFFVDGPLATGTDIFRLVAPRTMTIEAVYIAAQDLGSASATIVDVNLNGTTIFTTQSNRPELAYDDADGWVVSGTPEVVDVVEGDIVSFDIDQVATDVERLSVVVKIASTGSTPPAAAVPPALKVYMATTFR